MHAAVAAQSQDNHELIEFRFSAKLMMMKMQVGIESTDKQATASKQVEMFFSLTVAVPSLRDPSFLRFFLTMKNNLQLVMKNGGEKTTKNIIV